jgi:hypothetical protein
VLNAVCQHSVPMPSPISSWRYWQMVWIGGLRDVLSWRSRSCGALARHLQRDEPPEFAGRLSIERIDGRDRDLRARRAGRTAGSGRRRWTPSPRSRSALALPLRRSEHAFTWDHTAGQAVTNAIVARLRDGVPSLCERHLHMPTTRNGRRCQEHPASKPDGRGSGSLGKARRKAGSGPLMVRTWAPEMGCWKRRSAAWRRSL